MPVDPTPRDPLALLRIAVADRLGLHEQDPTTREVARVVNAALEDIRRMTSHGHGDVTLRFVDGTLTATDVTTIIRKTHLPRPGA